MLTKNEFYNKLKESKRVINKSLEKRCYFRFECDGIDCELVFLLTRFQSDPWRLEMQLINKKAESIKAKYIAPDVYGTFAELGIKSDYQAWKLVEKWIIYSVKKYKED